MSRPGTLLPHFSAQPWRLDLDLARDGCSRVCRDEQFVNYKTSTYKLHFYETPSGYKFVMLSDPSVDSLRFVLRQIYSGPFVEYVVRNPLAQMDSRERGIDNEYFRTSTDRMVRGLTVFE